MSRSFAQPSGVQVGAPATISVVMPAFRAAALLPRVLAPLLALREAGEVQEVIVVDDRSPDDTAAVARRLGAEVLTTPVNGGPGAARNLAAAQARGDILWFVDSDVVARADGPALIRRALAEPGVVAVFGSYDDAPEGSTWFSRYRNLLHRYHHQQGRAEAATFWAGCGAVDRRAFLAAGGFDTEAYPVPSIEDIELGYRLRDRGGRIRLMPELEAKHLKDWSLRQAVRTDVFQRALPWSRLMLARGQVTDDLNTGRAERVRAVIALALVLSVLALPVWPRSWPLPLALLALALAANWRLVRFLQAAGGTALAARALLWHQVYYLYASGAFAWCLLEHRLSGLRGRRHES